MSGRCRSRSSSSIFGFMNPLGINRSASEQPRGHGHINGCWRSEWGGLVDQLGKRGPAESICCVRARVSRRSNGPLNSSKASSGVPPLPQLVQAANRRSRG
jgi:hypothetical protein